MAETTSAAGPEIIGGGPKKVLYTLNTVRRIGLLNSAKALRSNNTCKACGLGMAGMVNELGEFPSVCNKSIQAQSTDIQPPIPEAVFEHDLDEFNKLDSRELETLGRLNTPLYKAADSRHYKPVSWGWALKHAAERFRHSAAERSFFYSSGRSSNEAGFVLQLLARLYGTNNVNNCSYYCHQATSEGLANSIGAGTATVELEDLTRCDMVFVIGANPASNHPRLIHQLQRCRQRGGEVIVINPAKEPGLVRFAVPKSARSMLSGGSEIASQYLQPRIGSDIALLSGIAKSVLAAGGEHASFIAEHSSGFEAYRQQVESSSWAEIEAATGLDRQQIEHAASRYACAERVIFCWGMGVTHHRHGVDNVEAIANLALLRGMVGKAGAGLLPLRGHSNVQGIGSVGVKPVLAAEVLSNIEREFGVTLPATKGLNTLACLERAHAGQIEAALMMGGNLYQASPDSVWTEQALNRIDFKLYLTTTLNRGHVCGVDDGEAMILPVTARDEEWQPTTQESMFNYLRISDGGITRLDNVRPEVDILCDIGSRLLTDSAFDFTQFKSHRTIRQAIAALVPGMEQLQDIDIAREAFHLHNRLLHRPEFHTGDKRALFISHHWQRKQHAEQCYPFTLMSVRSEGQFNSIIYEQADSYRGNSRRDVLMMAQQDMTALGLEQGSRVTLRSAAGSLAGLSVQCFDLPAGNVMAYYPEANVLIGREVDPRSQTPAFKSVAVSVVLCE